MQTWVIFTLFAALMQSIRTAGQKKLACTLSPVATTSVRYGFAIPLTATYLYCLVGDNIGNVVLSSAGNTGFLLYASLASVAQIVATVFLVKVLSTRNFAVGTILAKTEAIQTAALGVLFFSAYLSGAAWLAVALGAVGVVVLNRGSLNGQVLNTRSSVYGVLSGLGFALTALWVRAASLSLSYSLIENAALTLFYMVLLQSILCLAYILLREPLQLRLMLSKLPLAFFVGASSALGSIGWYTAMTYENAALVKTLGQIEILFALIITSVVFKERISKQELIGMLLLLCSVLLLLW